MPTGGLLCVGADPHAWPLLGPASRASVALIPPATQSDDGFKVGVADADPSIKYASTIVGNFNDAEKAKEAAAAQISAGADVIFALLDAGFPGVER